MPNKGFLTNHPDRVEEILARLSDGETLTGICQELGCSPSAVTHLADRDPDFAQRYARARQMQADALAEDVVRIADEEPDPAKARVRTDARKWLASKVNPAKFADKQQLEHTGKGGAPISVIEWVILDPKRSDAD